MVYVKTFQMPVSLTTASFHGGRHFWFLTENNARIRLWSELLACMFYGEYHFAWFHIFNTYGGNNEFPLQKGHFHCVILQFIPKLKGFKIWREVAEEMSMWPEVYHKGKVILYGSKFWTCLRENDSFTFLYSSRI